MVIHVATKLRMDDCPYGKVSPKIVVGSPADSIKITFGGIFSPSSENQTMSLSDFDGTEEVRTMLRELKLNQRGSTKDIWDYFQSMVQWRTQRVYQGLAHINFLKWATEQGTFNLLFQIKY